MGLEAPFEAGSIPDDATAGYRSCRSILVYPNTLQHFRDMDGVMAFLYLDPFSTDIDRIATAMQERDDRAAFGLAKEADVFSTLLALWRSEIDWGEARQALARDLLGVSRPVDARIAAALNLIHANPGARRSAAELAASASLSESRFLHLYTEETGVPLRRYKLGCAMGRAMRAIGRGESLTTAALDAGFSSSSHFSAAYREMFGIEPSQLPRARFVMREKSAG